MHRRSATYPRAVATRGEGGFTLIEVMVVVVIVGVLGALAVYGVRNYIASSKTSEAVSMMTTIRGGEESYKAETFVYLDVSGNFGGTNFYPSATVGNFKTQWGDASPMLAKWNTLGVKPDGPVYFSYACVATAPGTSAQELPGIKKLSDFGLPTTPDKWQYIAVAKGAPRGATATNSLTYVVTHSYSTEVYIENEAN